MKLNFEAYTWLMTLATAERRRIWRKLATNEWELKWNDECHSFELVPVS